MSRIAVSITLVLVAVACLWSAGSQNRELLAMRGEYHLTAAESLEDASPLMSFTTVVLGGFRGLIVDILWLRVSRLQDEGEIFELEQLADWITKFDPLSTDTWIFHAWNMAYNVSNMMPGIDERWRWIDNGVRLLRDQGMKYNPDDPWLHFELGWLYQHRIGSDIDKAYHAHYKRRLAEEIAGFFENGRPDFESLASDPEMTRRLREEHKLIPGIMQEIEIKYGPLDWRLAETHAIYWAYRGRRKADERASLFLDRMIYQSMGMLFLCGTVDFRPDDGVFSQSPNPSLLPYVFGAYEEALERHPNKSIELSYGAFLRRAVLSLHSVGEKEEARRTFDRLHRRFPGPDTEAGMASFLRSSY